MYKMLGLILVMSASVLTGITMSESLKDRVNCLKNIHQSSIHIKTDFEYRAPALEECFKGRGVLFSKAYDYIHNENYTPEHAVKEACRKINCIDKDDADIINTFSENLNAEDIAAEIANITWFITRIEERVRQAESEYRTRGKLYRSGGILTGLGIMIFLL